MADWLKQTIDHPLYDKLLWSRPETKARAGKLLIVGGNKSEFNAPAEAYNLSLKAGIGQAKVLMPLSLKPILGNTVEDAVFAPVTSVGSFSRQALAELTDYAVWANLTLLAGNLGHSSETAIMLESFIKDSKEPMVISSDSLALLITNVSELFNRGQLLIVSESSKFQKLLIKLHYKKALTSSMNLINLVDLLQELTLDYPVAVVLYWQQQIAIAYKGQVSTTPVKLPLQKWALIMSTYSAVWWAQNPTNLMESVTCAAYSLLAEKQQ